MSDFKPGDLVWRWDPVASQPTSGVVLEVQEARPLFSTLAPHDLVYQYVVLTNGQSRLISEDHLKRSREDCKGGGFIEDVLCLYGP
jgi:hypothetical protein